MERSAIRGRWFSSNAVPDFAALHPGYLLRRKKEAVRRQTQCFMSRTSGCGSRHGECGLRRLTAVGRARLPAFHHGSCGSDRTPPLSSSHALPGTVLGRCGRYPLPAVQGAAGCPADRSSCRPGFYARSRPGADRILPPAGTALAPSSGIPSRKASFTERDSVPVVTELVTNVNGNVTGLTRQSMRHEKSATSQHGPPGQARW
jgi:hypothetical protein